MQLSIINPLNYPGWDELLLKTPNSSFFHSSHWARVLNESYGYKPLYFSEINGNRLMTLISMMEVRSVLTCKRGVSLPFTDYCEPIIPEKKYFKNAMNYLIEYGKKSGWKSIELRSGNSLPHEFPPSSFYYGHTLGLSQGEERIFSNFRGSTRRNIRKAEREGVKVSLSNSLESIREFYRLNCLTRRMHGLPPQPYMFFKNIYEYVISKNHGLVVLASYGEETIAGAIYFHFGRKAVYKYGASERKYQHLRPNNLVMWEAIKWYCQNGYKSLSFGKTEPENTGLRQFKIGWGTEEQIIKYYKHDLVKGSFIRDSSKVTGLHNKVFNLMPIPLLNIIGSLFYKHVG